VSRTDKRTDVIAISISYVAVWMQNLASKILCISWQGGVRTLRPCLSTLLTQCYKIVGNNITLTIQTVHMHLAISLVADARYLNLLSSHPTIHCSSSSTDYVTSGVSATITSSVDHVTGSSTMRRCVTIDSCNSEHYCRCRRRLHRTTWCKCHHHRNHHIFVRDKKLTIVTINKLNHKAYTCTRT